MPIKLVALILCLACLSFASKLEAMPSARFFGESFEEAIQRASAQESSLLRSESVYAQAKALDDLDLTSVLEWKISRSPLDLFRWLRDLRFFEGHQGWLRRLSWLYPDDGCFARAEWMRLLLKEHHQLEIQKVFAFGNLEVDTPNHPQAHVRWWYHVVPIFRHEENLFVFDPAIDPLQPMTLNEWIAKMGAEEDPSFKLSICSGLSYSPSSSCQPDRAFDKSDADLQTYLLLESERIEEMGLQAEEVLKDKMTWLRNSELQFLRSIGWK